MNTLIRMEQILALIEANQGITSQELADACNVPWSLMQKDLETISLDIDNPIPLYTEEDNSSDNDGDIITPQKRWFLETSNKRNAPVHLTVGESLQILDALSFIKQEPSKQNSLKQKISTSLELENKGTYRYVKGSLVPVEQIDDQILMTVQQAINHRKKISFLFNSHSVVAIPLGLIYYSRLRQWYLAASLDEVIKTYSLAKIQRVQERSEEFVYPDNFSLRDWLAPRWGMEFGEPQRVKVRFTNRFQTIAKVRKDVAHRTCRLTEENDGQSILYEDTIVGKNEFVAWVLGFGSAAEVLEPEDIREEIMNRVKNTLARYK